MTKENIKIAVSEARFRGHEGVFPSCVYVSEICIPGKKNGDSARVCQVRSLEDEILRSATK